VLDVALPPVVEPRAVSMFLSKCSDAALSLGVAEAPRGEAEHALRPGTRTTLRDAPGRGRVLADIAIPEAKNEPSTAVVVLERRAKEARIRIDGDEASVEGWIDASVLVKVPGGGFGYGTGRGTLRPPSPYRCAFDVDVFVRDGGEAVRVGHVRANAPIRPGRAGEPTPAVVEIDLGALGQDALRPFVRAASLEGCKRE
jgi:hypothetical protein